jgi:agmatine deiminase
MHSSPPPEWAPHEAVWIGFPSDEELWEDTLVPAQFEVVAFAKAIHADGAGEAVWLVANDEMAAAKARKLAPFAKVVVERFGDIWLRDTGAIVTGTGADRRAQGFRFNGWGEKYDLAGDESIGERLAAAADIPFAKADWVLEGGAIDGRWHGRVPDHEQCCSIQPQPGLRQGRNRSAA